MIVAPIPVRLLVFRSETRKIRLLPAILLNPHVIGSILAIVPIVIVPVLGIVIPLIVVFVRPAIIPVIGALILTALLSLQSDGGKHHRN
jgi:hypothetical protein